MTRKRKKQPTRLDLIDAKVDHLVLGVDKIVSRVDKLERKASFWGAVGGIATAIVAHMGGCL